MARSLLRSIYSLHPLALCASPCRPLYNPSFVRSMAINTLGITYPPNRSILSSPSRRSTTLRRLNTQSSSSASTPPLNINPRTIQEHIDRNLDDREVPMDRKNIVSLPDGNILKTGTEHCRTDYAWLKAFESCDLPDWVRVPKLRSSLVEFGWEGLHQYAFAMEKISFPTLEETLKTKPISAELADRIVEGLSALRTALATVKTTDAIPGLDKCLLQGHMFPPNEDSCWTASSQDEVKRILDEKSVDGNEFIGSWEWAWGDCSPGNIYISPEDDKTIYYADFGYAMNLPPEYDRWTLMVSHYSPNFTAPLIRAFARKSVGDLPINFEAFTKMRNRYRVL